MEAVTIPASGSQAVKTHLFAGAKKVNLINGYENDLKILEFNYMVDWGWFMALLMNIRDLPVWSAP